MIEKLKALVTPTPPLVPIPIRIDRPRRR